MSLAKVDANYEKLFWSHRSAMLPYSSYIVTIARTVMWLPLYLWSPRSESTKLMIPLVKATDGICRNSTVKWLFVRMQPRKIRTYEACLVFSRSYQGLRSIVASHPVLSYLVLSSVFWISFATISIATAIAFFLLYGHSSAVQAPISFRSKYTNVKKDLPNAGSPAKKSRSGPIGESELDNDVEVKTEDCDGDFLSFLQNHTTPQRYHSEESSKRSTKKCSERGSEKESPKESVEGSEKEPEGGPERELESVSDRGSEKESGRQSEKSFYQTSGKEIGKELDNRSKPERSDDFDHSELSSVAPEY